MSGMAGILKSLPRLAMRKTGLYSVYYLARYGYLLEQNWYASYDRSAVIGPGNEPLPWLTYSAIHFLEPRLTRSMRVFEFGAGNSTLWWAKRVAKVIAVEHSEDWYALLRSSIPSNVDLLFRRVEDGSYARSAVETDERFDVICVDGRDRVNCALHSCELLTDGGVIVWDNTDRVAYTPGFEFLKRKDFRRIDFHGMGPRCVEGWTTSIFYRANNCLAI